MRAAPESPRRALGTATIPAPFKIANWRPVCRVRGVIPWRVTRCAIKTNTILAHGIPLQPYVSRASRGIALDKWGSRPLTDALDSCASPRDVKRAYVP